VHAPPANPEPHDDSTLIAFLSAALSFGFLAHYYRWSQILLSGDAVAHINIARRVFDSLTPGPSELGTVWLPLQHILTIPFVISDFGWSSGIGGAIPSMLGYVLGVVGVYRLVRTSLLGRDFPQATLALPGAPLTPGSGLGGDFRHNFPPARIAAWLAAVIYAANPNLLYVQTTALNEPLTMGLFAWAVLMFLEFWRAAGAGDDDRAASRLRWCGWLLMAAMLIRYDGWFVGCVLIVAAAATLLVIARRRARGVAPASRRQVLTLGVVPRLRRALLAFVLLNAAAPAFWFAYNGIFWGNPLEFATGPYSAKAIEERTRKPGDPHHPGGHAPYVAAEYFLRDLELNLAGGPGLVRDARPGFLERIWLPVAVLGSLALLLAARSLWPLLLLWIPLPFYAIAIAWEGIPIFIPPWWPFSYYNTRYALQLLPMVAVMWGVAAYFAMTGWRRRWLRAAIPAAVVIFVGFSYASVWRSVPICLREVRVNGGPRYALDGLLAFHLRRLPPGATLLVYIGDHGGALLRAELPLRRTINESTFRLWDKALQNPAASADFIIAGAGDPVAQAVARHPQNLVMLGVLETPGQPPIRIYASQISKK
jgi:hypothetical protein